MARDLSHVDRILAGHPDALGERQMAILQTIRKLYEQQKELYDKRTHSVTDRIVSLSQPYERPDRTRKGNRAGRVRGEG